MLTTTEYRVVSNENLKVNFRNTVGLASHGRGRITPRNNLNCRKQTVIFLKFSYRFNIFVRDFFIRSNHCFVDNMTEESEPITNQYFLLPSRLAASGIKWGAEFVNS